MSGVSAPASFTPVRRNSPAWIAATLAGVAVGGVYALSPLTVIFVASVAGWRTTSADG